MLKDVLNEINNLVSAIDKLPTISIENKRKLEGKFRLEFNYNSNHIEGNTLTYGETQLLLIFDKTDGTHDFREYQEMKSHDAAHKLILEWANDPQFRLTEMHLKQLNELLLVEPFWKDAITESGQATKRQIKIGQYKEFPNSVRLANGSMFEYASPVDTPIKMGELMMWYNEEIEKNELHPIILAVLFHYKFVLIHPFDDGNGRISRLMTNYILYKNNLPPIIVKTKDKKNYLNALNKADSGNINAFIEYMAKELIWSLELLLKASKGESIEEADDWEKELELLKRKEDDLPPSRTAGNTIDRLKDSIFPLCKQIIAICDEKFMDLFSDTNHSLARNNLGMDGFLKSENLVNLSDTDVDLTKNQSITFTKTFLRFKKNDTNAFNIQLTLTIILKTYSYDVTFENANKVVLSKKIGEGMQETDFSLVINEFGKQVISMIKKELTLSTNQTRDDLI